MSTGPTLIERRRGERRAPQDGLEVCARLRCEDAQRVSQCQSRSDCAVRLIQRLTGSRPSPAIFFAAILASTPGSLSATRPRTGWPRMIDSLVRN